MSFKTVAALLDGVHTDFVVSIFEDTIFIAITQNSKLGTLYLFKPECLSAHDQEYDLKVLFGREDDNVTSSVHKLQDDPSHPRSPLDIDLNRKTARHKTMPLYGQVVIGPPGSGKTTYCDEMSKYLREMGRRVAIINIDPANDSLTYDAAVDISELITVEDVMDHVNLGPNGSLIFCMEFLEKRLDWLLEKLKKLSDYYLIFDCPGQVEIYTHHNSMKNITSAITNELDLRLCCVQLIDCHYCSDPGKYISALLMCTSTMYQMELPHVNVLSKVDVAVKHKSELLFNLDFYTDVLGLDHLLNALQNDPLTARYHRLNKAIVSLIEGQNIVSFVPLNVKDKRTMELVRKNIDRANGYIFSAEENQNTEMLNSVMQLDINDLTLDVLEDVPKNDSIENMQI